MLKEFQLSKNEENSYLDADKIVVELTATDIANIKEQRKVITSNEAINSLEISIDGSVQWKADNGADTDDRMDYEMIKLYDTFFVITGNEKYNSIDVETELINYEDIGL